PLDAIDAELLSGEADALSEERGSARSAASDLLSTGSVASWRAASSVVVDWSMLRRYTPVPARPMPNTTEAAASSLKNVRRFRIRLRSPRARSSSMFIHSFSEGWTSASSKDFQNDSSNFCLSIILVIGRFL